MKKWLRILLLVFGTFALVIVIWLAWLAYSISSIMSAGPVMAKTAAVKPVSSPGPASEDKNKSGLEHPRQEPRVSSVKRTETGRDEDENSFEKSEKAEKQRGDSGEVWASLAKIGRLKEQLNEPRLEFPEVICESLCSPVRIQKSKGGDPVEELLTFREQQGGRAIEDPGFVVLAHLGFLVGELFPLDFVSVMQKFDSDEKRGLLEEAADSARLVWEFTRFVNHMESLMKDPSFKARWTAIGEMLDLRKQCGGGPDEVSIQTRCLDVARTLTSKE